MSKNYFVVATITSVAIVAGVLGYGSTANAWGGPHHAQDLSGAWTCAISDRVESIYNNVLL